MVERSNPVVFLRFSSFVITSLFGLHRSVEKILMYCTKVLDSMRRTKISLPRICPELSVHGSYGSLMKLEVEDCREEVKGIPGH